MKKSKPRRIFLMSPYLFSLICVFGLLLLFTNGLMLRFCFSATQGMAFPEIIRSGIFHGVLLILSLTLLLFGIFLRNSYEYFGWVEICSDRLVFHALLHRPRVFLYVDLREIGIDYGQLPPKLKQFWIYFSKDTVDRKYTHNILSLPFSADTMRVQYRRELYDALLAVLPNDRIRKQLSRSHSVIKLHHIED